MFVKKNNYEWSNTDTPGWVIPMIAVPWVLFTLNTTCILVYIVFKGMFQVYKFVKYLCNHFLLQLPSLVNGELAA